MGAVLLAFRVMTGLTEDRTADANRCMYPGAVLMIAFVAVLLDGIRLPRLLPAALLPIVAFSVWTGMGLHQDGRRDLSERTIITRSALHVLDSRRGSDLVDVRLGPELSGYEHLRFITPRSYFRASDLYGSPAFSDSEIRSAGDLAEEASEAGSAGLARASRQQRWTRSVQRAPKWPSFP